MSTEYCIHEWTADRTDEEVVVTVLHCALCDALWLPDVDPAPPAVPRLL